VKHNRALHGRVLALTVLVRSTPWLKDGARLTVEEIAPNFWRAKAEYGFMEHPDIPALVREAHAHGCGVDLDDITYYVGHETVIPRDDGKGLPYPMEVMFAWMQRNSSQVSDFFSLPQDHVVEIGRQVEI
jgi:KUP system potassium uptake protein